MKTTARLVLAALVAAAPSSAGSLAGTVTVDGLSTNADAVVYIDAIPGKTFPTPTEHAKMDQVSMQFTPRVLPVQVGATVDFHNSDNVAHNVFSPEKCAGEFDLGNWNRGEVRSQTFDEECQATVLCFVHAKMEAFVVAVPTPYFAVTSATGRFEIPELPDGTYTVKVWHPTRKPVTREIEVRGATSLDLTLAR